MKNFEFSNIDGDELDDFISTIEKSFDIQFGDDELTNVFTMGELCEIIKIKANNNTQGCTSQQAFYKLKDAIHSVFPVNEKIQPNTLLSDIFPKQDRIKTIQTLEQQIGFKLNILTADTWIQSTLILMFLIGIPTLFFNDWLGIALIVISIVGLKIALKTGAKLTLKTIGELANHIKSNNYTSARRNTGTYNHNEIEDVVVSILISITGFTKEELVKMSA